MTEVVLQDGDLWLRTDNFQRGNPAILIRKTEIAALCPFEGSTEIVLRSGRVCRANGPMIELEMAMTAEPGVQIL